VDSFGGLRREIFSGAAQTQPDEGEQVSRLEINLEEVAEFHRFPRIKTLTE
jgi:hypothetical protein